MYGKSGQTIAQRCKTPSKDHAIDYVLVYNDYHNHYPIAVPSFGARASTAVAAKQAKLATLRHAFEAAMVNAQLVLEKEYDNDRVFVKIHCPFKRLALEAERVRLEMPLRGCEIEDEPSCFSTLRRYFETDDEVDFVSAPFDRSKLHLFEGSDEIETFFRSSLRGLLVHHMLINLSINDLPGANVIVTDTEQVSSAVTHYSTARHQGLLYMLMKSAYRDAFVLHNASRQDPYYRRLRKRNPAKLALLEPLFEQQPDPRKELHDTWTKFTKFQPLWKIRNYFGEKIAFYFAWQGTLVTVLWLPALLGVISFLYGLYLSAVQQRIDFCMCDESGNKTAVADQACVKKSLIDVLAEDILLIIRKAFNNELNPFFSLFICIWGSLFLEIWKRKHVTLAYEWDVNNYQDTEPDRPEFYGTDMITDPITKEAIWIFPARKRIKYYVFSILVIFGMMCLVFLALSGVIAFKTWFRVAHGCPGDGYEPGVCSDKVDDPWLCLFVGTLFPAFLNAMSVVIFEVIYYYVAMKLNELENHQTQSDFDNALVIKLFVFQFVNSYAILFYIAFFRPSSYQFQNYGLFGMGIKYRDVCARGSCMSLMALQVLLLMIAKPIAKFAYDMLLPQLLWLFRIWRRWWRSKMISPKTTADAHSTHDVDESVIDEDEDDKMSTASTTKVQEGNASLFDADALTREWRKAPLGDFCVDEFNEKTIQFGYIVMFAAAFPLAPFIALIVNLIDMRVDARRLLWFNKRPVAEISSDIGMWQPILRFLNFCGVVMNAYLVMLSQQLTETDSFVVFVGFEHIVFFLIFIVDVLIPDVPTRIRHAMRRERYQVQKVLDDIIPLSRVGSRKMSRQPNAAVAPLAVHDDDMNATDAGVMRTDMSQRSEESHPHVMPDSSIDTNSTVDTVENSLTVPRHNSATREQNVVVPNAFDLKSTSDIS